MNNNMHQAMEKHWLYVRQDSASVVPVEPTTATTAAPTTSAVTPVEPSTTAVSSPSTTAAAPSTTAAAPTTATTSTTAPVSSSARTSSSASPSASSSSSSSSSIVSSTSTSVSVVVVTSVETVSGSTRTLTSASSSTALIPTTAAAQQGGGGGLSTGAKNGIIGAASGVGGLLVLGAIFFLVTRYLRKRRTQYVPGEDEIRWPEAEQDSGALFAPAVRRTGGAGLGRETSMRSTTSGIPASITTAGYNPNAASSDGHNAAGFGAGFGAGAVGGAGAAYYSSQDGHQQEDLAPNTRYSAYSQPGYGGYDYDPHDPQDTQNYQYEESIRSSRGQLKPTNYSNLDNIYER